MAPADSLPPPTSASATIDTTIESAGLQQFDPERTPPLPPVANQQGDTTSAAEVSQMVSGPGLELAIRRASYIARSLQSSK